MCKDGFYYVDGVCVRTYRCSASVRRKGAHALTLGPAVVVPPASVRAAHLNENAFAFVTEEAPDSSGHDAWFPLGYTIQPLGGGAATKYIYPYMTFDWQVRPRRQHHAWGRGPQPVTYARLACLLLHALQVSDMCFQSLDFVLSGANSTLCDDNDLLHIMGFVDPQGWSPWSISWNNQPEVLWPNATFTFGSGQWFRGDAYVRTPGAGRTPTHLRANIANPLAGARARCVRTLPQDGDVPGRRERGGQTASAEPVNGLHRAGTGRSLYAARTRFGARTAPS